MPSPFPGMDPYLEHPKHFPTLHQKFIVHLEERLQKILPDAYFAKHNQRVWVEYTDRYLEPDVNIVRNSPPARPRPATAPSGSTLLDAPPPYVVRVQSIANDEVTESFVDIYLKHGPETELVTTIELLSLSNKTPGDHGQSQYRRKQRKVLKSPVHFVEIDLLRGGIHSTSVAYDMARQACGDFDYHVCVHRGGEPDYLVYPFLLATPLGPIHIPLRGEDQPVTVDLQVLLDECYDAGSFRREIDYARDEIVPPLNPEQQAWAAQVVNEYTSGRK